MRAQRAGEVTCRGCQESGVAAHYLSRQRCRPQLGGAVGGASEACRGLVHLALRRRQHAGDSDELSTGLVHVLAKRQRKRSPERAVTEALHGRQEEWRGAS